uniref:Uncharacterized protein n=1 Tax=Anguilla anguilla TaxID=7936 RepID=A0A0E9S815_ANGAN
MSLVITLQHYCIQTRGVTLHLFV